MEIYTLVAVMMAIHFCRGRAISFSIACIFHMKPEDIDWNLSHSVWCRVMDYLVPYPYTDIVTNFWMRQVMEFLRKGWFSLVTQRKGILMHPDIS